MERAALMDGISPAPRKGRMDRNRVLELALESLQKQRAEVEAEIESVRTELQGTGTAIAIKPGSSPEGTGRRHPRTPGTAQSTQPEDEGLLAGQEDTGEGINGH